ncbi:PPC domain-containing protein [Microbulbifer pacificus]|uniref:PPC domain-containing protein n=1 Tax=Microbulbifer pacificus TaxID=407164 RepID=UPI0018F8B6F1|nr:PPC domain-containing protein [Microbulbifer pacificus]
MIHIRRMIFALVMLASFQVVAQTDNILSDDEFGMKFDLTASQGEELHFTYTLESDAPVLNFLLTDSYAFGPATGDADLYVRRGAPPNISTYDCRPWLNGSKERCYFSDAEPGIYYVMVRGYTAFTKVSLMATTPRQLHRQLGQSTTLPISIPEGAQDVVIRTYGESGSYGEADLYVYSADTAELRCASTFSGTEEICFDFDHDGNRSYNVALSTSSHFDKVTMEIDYKNGFVWEEVLSGEQDSWQHFMLSPPPEALSGGLSALKIQVSGRDGNGDIDLFVSQGRWPSEYSSDCHRTHTTTGQIYSVAECNFEKPEGHWYVSVRGRNSYSGTKLRMVQVGY